MVSDFISVALALALLENMFKLMNAFWYLVIGIHLGNDYSSVGIFNNDAFILIVNGRGKTKTPNYVAFTDQGPLVGLEAKEQANENPQNTIYDFR